MERVPVGCSYFFASIGFLIGLNIFQVNRKIFPLFIVEMFFALIESDLIYPDTFTHAC